MSFEIIIAQLAVVIAEQRQQIGLQTQRIMELEDQVTALNHIEE